MAVRRLLVVSTLVVLALTLDLSGASAEFEADVTPPRIVIGYPREGARIARLSTPGAGWNCHDEVGGSGVVECSRDAASDDQFDTTTVGPRQYTITAVDRAGNRTSLTVHFRVVEARCGGRPVDTYLSLGHQPTDGDDVILGGPHFLAQRGNDDIYAGRGDDVVCGWGGADVIRGGPGDDLLIGGDGRDTLIGGPGNDRLAGSFDHDRLNGGRGTDLLAGGDGADVLLGGHGIDWLDGGPVRDTCYQRPGERDLLTSCEVRPDRP